MPTNTVYVFTRGEKYEGGHVQGVFATEAAALAAAWAAIVEDESEGTAQEVTPEMYRGKKGWEVGCDFFLVEACPVQ